MQDLSALINKPFVSERNGIKKTVLLKEVRRNKVKLQHLGRTDTELMDITAFQKRFTLEEKYS